VSSKTSLIFKSSGFRVLNTLVGVAIGILMMPFLINTLGQELYGLWIVIGSIVGTYYLLDLGFNQAVTRYVSKYIHQNNPEAANRIINTALVIYSVLGIVVLVISIIAAHYGAEKLMDNTDNLDVVKMILIITGLSLAIEFPAKAFPGILSAYMRYDFIALVKLGKSVLDAVLIYMFLSNGYGLVAMALIMMITGLVSTAIYVKFTTSLFKELEFKKSAIDAATLKDVFHFSKWVFLLDINTMLRNKMDIWFIAFYQFSGILTAYYVAVRLVEYAITFLTQATGFSGPIFTEYYAKGAQQELKSSISFFIKVSLLLATTFYVGFLLLGYSFIKLWMGESFQVEDTFICLLILAVGRFSVYCAAPFQSLLLTLNKHNVGSVISLMETVIIGFLLTILVPKFGIIGASISISAPLVVGRLLIIPLYIQSLMNIDLHYLICRIAIFLVVAALFAYSLYCVMPDWRSLSIWQVAMSASILSAGQLIIGFLLFNSSERLVIKDKVIDRIFKKISKN
jgi:O-antigen/teichoic acid export membrane protein